MIFTDLLWAYRSLVRSKGFFATAVLTLGLALGVCTTTFGILEGVRHPYTPIYQPTQAFTIQPNGAERDSRATVYERYRMIRDGAQFASEVALVTWRFSVVRVGENENQMVVQEATPNLLTLLGVQPLLGRWFDSTAGPHGSVVLGESVWRSLFPKRSSLSGAAVTIDGRTLSVIGVVPDGLGGIYLPLAADQPPVPPNKWGQIFARLKPGVTRDDAHRQVALIARRLNERYDPVGRTFSFNLVDMAPQPVGGRTIDVVLAGVGALVLLIACANLAGMMLARGLARRRDIALRLALGASRSAIVRMLVAESLVIAAAGGAIGVPGAVWGISLVRHEVPRQVWSIGVINPHLSWRVFAFAFAAAAAVGLAVGVFPGLRASQVDLNEPLKDDSGNTTGRRRQRYSPLAIGELATAMTLLMGTGLLVRAAHRIATYDFGFDPEHLVVTRIWLWQQNDSVKAGRASFTHLLEVASQVPGVKGVAVLSGGGGNLPRQVFPDQPLPDRRMAMATVARATTNFNEVLGLPILRGRGFEPGDIGGYTAIVDESAARELWGGEDVIGRTFKVGSWQSKVPWFTVIGVIRNGELGFRSDPYLEHTPAVYLPPKADGDPLVTIVARVRGKDATVAAALAREMQSAFGLRYRPNAGPFAAAAGQEGFAAAHNFIAELFGALGAIVLGLSAVGLYAVVSYSVNQRRREFAVRAALGATSRVLFRLAAHDGLVMTLAGTGIGAFLAMASAMALDQWLYGVYPVDVLSLIAAEAALCMVAFLACLGPARRAMRADPAEILRAV